MKTFNHKKIWLLLFMSLCISSYSQEESGYFYYHKGEKIFLKLDTKTIALTAEGENSSQAIKNYLANKINQKLTLVQEDNSRGRVTIIDQKAQNKRGIKTNYMEITLDQPLSKLDYLTQIANYKKLPSVITVSPCFVTEDGGKMGLLNTFNVQLKEEKDIDLLYEKAEKLNVEVLGYNKFMPLWFTLSCGIERNSLEAANLFYEMGLFQSAQPEFKHYDLDTLSKSQSQNAKLTISQEGLPNSITGLLQNSKSSFRNSNLIASPNDPFFYPFQWGLYNDGTFYNTTSGIDIKAKQAWEISKGAGIKVAIVDQGFEMDHPDLKNNVFEKGYDASAYNNPNFINPAKVYGFHGTLCAGVVGAVQNNGIGCSGVAPESKLMSISMNFQDANFPGPLGITLGWINGADVLSNSWGFPERLEILDKTVDDALTKGRGGKGSVVVFASGNENRGFISTPSKNNPLVLVVGAIDGKGKRAVTPSRKGSNYGTELDVVAPGDVIVTTDMQGQKGVNKRGAINELSDFDYSIAFGLTSAAAAFVAGVAALVLSVNSDLTVKGVNDIIEKTAQKVRPDLYTYSRIPNRPNGTWNNEVGYGLVNAYEAVKLAIGEDVCLVDEEITGSTPDVDFKQASGSITASNFIATGAKAIYNAGHYIALKIGFIAEPGCVFEADIEGCSGNGNRKSIAQPEEKISYAFRYNSTKNNVANNLDANNQEDFGAVPNPFTHTITINYTIAANSGNVSLDVYDMAGMKVAGLLAETNMESGTHAFEWDASRFPSGTYLVKLTTASEEKTIKVVKL